MFRAWVLLLAGCGRVGFGSAEIDGGVTDAVVIDLAPVPPMLRFGNRPDVDVMDTIEDTLIDSSLPARNFGNHVDLHLTTDPVLIRIDVSGVPQHAAVTRARLVLFVATFEVPVTARVEAYRVIEAWTEGTGDNMDGSCNYTTRLTGTPWIAAGVGSPGSREPVAIATTLGPVTTGSALVMDLPPTVVDQWVAQPATNFGLVMLSLDTPTPYTEIGSSEHPDPTLRPVLELELR